MALTCLQIIQTVSKRLGLTAPVSAVGSSDPGILQLLSLVEEEGQDQAQRYPWQVLQSQATFTTLATQVQTALSAITSGFEYIVNDTIWNRTLRRPVYGPKSQQDWQQSLAMNINGPFNSFRIIGDSINFNPAPVAGQACYFEYITDQWITTSAGGTSSIFTNDADVPKLDSQLVVLGAIWRWRQAKGLDFTADNQKYERRILDDMARDGGKPTLNMGGARYEIQPAIVVPAGSWNV